jgi:hypothetical protein
MRNSRKVETRRDRIALARDAGMGRLSALSVLAGALVGLATLEALMAIAGAVGVGLNGGTNFAAMSDGEFKTIIGIILVVALFIAFMLGGYVSGRMSRRSGASHGLLGGVVGVILAAAAGAVIVGTGTDNGLARAAQHIGVAATWHQWRYFGLIGIVVAAAAIILGSLAGGIDGERWHGKLLARAVDPAYGPEAEERAEARKRITEAEVARLAAADHVGRLTGATKSAHATPAATEPVAPAAPVAVPVANEPIRETAVPVASQPARKTAVPKLIRTSGTSSGADAPVVTADGTTVSTGTDTEPQPRRHHLLGRR